MCQEEVFTNVEYFLLDFSKIRYRKSSGHSQISWLTTAVCIAEKKLFATQSKLKIS